ncbi:FG-GAP repeat domain-containing protein [Nannocystis radixulma]|uniref:VCBS repeat-containing protein n=1 Tax=Nannocystis radixulma TaxID=2995305 RepID=A0ABT5BK02_9BACT|nr:VCBS repeat-containing protein [Nannocystis radixulma]MDC0674484.1 VCBS repeat-containing protein [Nannocystis radixulma]
MMPRRRSASWIVALAPLGLFVAACGAGDEACDPRAGWCGGDPEFRLLATPVDDAVVVDLDGDGEDEAVMLSDGRKLTLAHGTDLRAWRTSVALVGPPMALAALPGEVAVALSKPPQLAIFAMDADRRLVRRRDIPLSQPPVRLDSADLAGDGAPELLVALPDAKAIAVVDPRDGAVREYPAGEQPIDLEVGDVDGDAHADVVVVDAAGALQLLRGAGDGTLKPAVAQPGSEGEFWLVLADHDGDGDLDAVARNALQQSVLFHRNDGHGRFSSPIALPVLPAAAPSAGLVASPASPSGLASVSVPRDDTLVTWVGKGAAWLGRNERELPETRWVGPGPGDQVLVGSRHYLARLSWRAGFRPLEVWRSPPLKFYYERSLATGDLDSDHLLDFAATSTNRLRLFHGRADGGFDHGLQYELDAPATAMVTADVSGDGRDDIVLDDGDDVRALIAGEDGQFLAGPRVVSDIPARALVPLRTGAGQPTAIAVLATKANFDDVEVPGARVLRFDGDGLATVTTAIEDLVVEALAPVDLDADGVDEPLILGRRDGAPVLTHLTPANDAFEPDFEHDLAALDRLPIAPRARLTAADLDGDGDPEVFFGDDNIRWRMDGLADGAPVTTFEEQAAPSHLHDLDGDELLDAVMFDYPIIAYQRGLGDGTLAAERVETTLPGGLALALASRPDAQFDLAEVAPQWVASHIVREFMRPGLNAEWFALHGPGLELLDADLDGDGRDDVVVRSDGGVVWSWGSETDPLVRTDGVTFVGWSPALATGDFDGDGFSEVLTVNFSDFVEAFRIGPQLTEQPLVVDRLTTQGISHLAVADVDGDGHLDILALHMLHVVKLDVARGTAEPFTFEPWQSLADVPRRDFAESFQLGDVDDDGDLDAVITLLENPPVLLRNDGPSAWSVVDLPGRMAAFGKLGPDHRVELVTQDGATIYRHEAGDPERRVALVTEEAATLLRVADVDGDERYDLTVVEKQATFAWLLGHGPPARIQLAEAPLTAVAYPDVDGDGAPDLVGLAGDGMLMRRGRRLSPDVP